MTTFKSALCRTLALLVIANADVAAAEGPKAHQTDARSVERKHQSLDVPQAFVVCTGWHALCTASHDCKMTGDTADCDCLRVNEPHIVATSEIQDNSVKHLTELQCTNEHPCDVDRAPVCDAIQSGRYRVDNVRYAWVSTYSYRGWCGLLSLGLTACDVDAEGYVGDRYFAICDGAPCTEIPNPSDPQKPLSCRCRVASGAFVGMNDSCTGENGGIMSSMPLWAWDFENATYPFPMPGYEYVRGACAALMSDPAEESRRHGDSR